MKRLARALGILVLCGLVLCLAGCKHDRSQAVAASYSSVTKPAPIVTVPLSAIGVDAVPVEEEYEERSTAAITPANLTTQISEIEREIGH